MALDGNRVLQRWFDCWCPACRKAQGPGQGMDSNYKVVECETKEPWWEYTVQQLGARGIGRTRKVAQDQGRAMAEKLKPGEFIAVQDREDGNHTVPFMIGVTLDTGDGTCFAVPKEGRQNVNRTRFDDGEYGIAVRWLGRLAEDAELRTFDLVADCAEEFIVNSTELRCSEIEMIPVQPVGPAVRRSGRGKGRDRGRPTTGPRPGQYTLPIETEQLILRTCW